MIGLSFLIAQLSYGELPVRLQSSDGQNVLYLILSEQGKLYYEVKRCGKNIIKKSPMGLRLQGKNFQEGLVIDSISSIEETREKYTLKVGNKKEINQTLRHRSVSLLNKRGDTLILDLVAGNEGVAFRYRIPNNLKEKLIVKDELTEFSVGSEAEGWLQPYNKAGDYTPAYEDFYFHISQKKDTPTPRNPSTGWCMPALFNVNKQNNWILIAESEVDGKYPGCHLNGKVETGAYKISFAKADEMYNLPLKEVENAYPESELPWRMPWRVIIIGDQAGDILLSSLITDLAPKTKIKDTSWIEPGKASWSWWSHPDDNDPEVYNKFTGLAESFNWEYTLFDAGWEDAEERGGIIEKALSKGVKPMVWGYSGDYFDANERKKRFKELSKKGVKGVKIDFWCSDRQEVMEELHSLFEDAANEKLLVNLHGNTVPRGWHRTWPNFITAEAVLGTESYFYEKDFPKKAAEQNTVLPFTRNVVGPTDYTPVALTNRKFSRQNTAIHELATSLIYTSGIIHFADSKQAFESLPEDVVSLLKEMPATWDNTECILAEPGDAIILLREKDSRKYIVGINGTDEKKSIKINLSKYNGKASNFNLFSEGEDPLTSFDTNIFTVNEDWAHIIPPKGGFIIQFMD